MSLAATAAVIGIVAAGVGAGISINNLVNAPSGTNANVPSGAPGTPTIGDLLTTGNNLATQEDDTLQSLLQTQQATQTEVGNAVTEAEYAALGLAVVSLACVLFLKKKREK